MLVAENEAWDIDAAPPTIGITAGSAHQETAIASPQLLQRTVMAGPRKDFLSADIALWLQCGHVSICGT
jgi:hypothetical protein